MRKMCVCVCVTAESPEHEYLMGTHITHVCEVLGCSWNPKPRGTSAHSSWHVWHSAEVKRAETRARDKNDRVVDVIDSYVMMRVRGLKANSVFRAHYFPLSCETTWLWTECWIIQLRLIPGSSDTHNVLIRPPRCLMLANTICDVHMKHSQFVSVLENIMVKVLTSNSLNTEARSTALCIENPPL